MKSAIFLLFLRWNIVSALSGVEVEFITEFLRFLSRTNCALVGDPTGMRNFARMFTYSSYVPVRNVPEFLSYQERYTAERIVLVSTGYDLTTYQSVFQKVPTTRMLSRVTWIVIVNASLDLSGVRVQIPYDTEFFLVEPHGEDAFNVREIFSERNVPAVYWDSYGVWSRRNGLTASRLSFFSRRKNLDGYPMTVLTLQKECQSAVQCSLREIWFDLARYLNITTRLSTVGEHGSVSWDANIEPMTYDAYTKPIASKAIAPIWRLSVFMHVKHESDMEFSWWMYFSVMWDTFFLYFLVWIACLTLWLTIFEYVHSLLYRRRFNAWDGIFAGISWICNQGGVSLQPNFSLLFVVLMVRIVVLAVEILGTGTLVSFLALRTPHYPFYDLDGFFEDGTYTLGTVNGSLSQFYFDNNPITERRNLSRKMLPAEKAPNTLIEAMGMLCDDAKFVVLADENDFMALRKSCQILQIPVPAATISCGIALGDESPFEFIFNSAFMKFLESGIIDKMRRRIYKGWGEEEGHLHPVTFRQVRSFFVIIECGIIASFLAWIAENACHALELRFRANGTAASGLPGLS